jgi:hypothetical protein
LEALARCWYILWPFGVFYEHWVYFVVNWYIFSRFGMLYQEISGNPDQYLCKPSRFSIRMRVKAHFSDWLGTSAT